MSTERDAPESDAPEPDGGGYVHRPNATPGTERNAETGTAGGADETNARGWALVGIVVLCFLVIPGIIYLRPATPAEAGLPFFAAMLVLPMAPALLLGLTAVWSLSGGPTDDTERSDGE